MRVTLAKPRHGDVEYPCVVVFDDGTHIVVRGIWSRETARDLGFVRFEPGDEFTEHYWRDRSYTVKEVRHPRWALIGWYCDVARPARVGDGVLVSADLDLDLWVPADGGPLLRLDEDEFASSGLAERDPAAAAEARRAVDELVDLAADGFSRIAV